MGFTEAQQKVINYVQTDKSVSNDFLKARKEAEAQFTSEVTQKEKDAAMWELAKEYYQAALEKNDKNAKALQDTSLALSGNEATQLKSSVEQEQQSSKSFFNLIKNNTETYEKIASFVVPNATKQEQESKVKERSDKIENVLGDFALGALPEEIKKVLEGSPQLQNIKTGLSLYFTDWFNHLSVSDMKQVGEVGGFGGLVSKAGDLMAIFGKLSSFNNQMTAINAVVDAMDIHSGQLSSVDESNGKNRLQTLDAFSSPENFYKLLTKHTPKRVETDNSVSTTGFEKTFDIKNQTNPSVDQIITTLGKKYNNKTNSLMTAVLDKGPKILEQRTELQSTFGVVYDQLNQVAQLFGGESIAKSLEGTALGRVANFVCALLGFGSLAQIERKKSLKEYNKNCPERQREGIENALQYIKQFGTEAFYTDQTNNPLHNQFKNLPDSNYTDTKTTKDAVLGAIPNDKLLKDSVVSSIDRKGFFVHPQVLVGAKISNFNIDDYYDGDGEKIPYRVKENKKEDYKKFISDHIDVICNSAWTPLLQSPDTIIQLVASGKTQADIAQLFVTSISLPQYASTIIQDKLMTTIGASNTTIALVGYGAEQQAEALKKKQEEEKKNKTKEELQKELDEVNKQIGENTGKGNNNSLTDEQKEDLKKKADELAGKKTELEAKIAELGKTTTPTVAVIGDQNKPNTASKETNTASKKTENQAKTNIETLNTEYDIAKVQNYIDTHTMKGKVCPVTAQEFVKIAKEYSVPLELMLAQAQQESHFGTDGDRPIRTKNIFNVGNTDDDKNRTMSSRIEGVKAYAELMQKSYLQHNRVSVESLLNNGMRNKNNKQYAPGDYAKKIENIMTAIKPKILGEQETNV